LFVLLLVDNSFFDRMLNESARGPLTRPDLDVSAVGDNTNFWVDNCSAFKDDVHPRPAQIQTNNNIFFDKITRNSYCLAVQSG
jgi:hypothetical protein